MLQETETFFKRNEPKSGPLNARYTDIEPEVWQKEIKEVWKHLSFKGEDDPSDERFIEAIWNASKNILPTLMFCDILFSYLAPRAGFEPATRWLTATCSTN